MASLAKKLNDKLGSIFYKMAEQSEHVFWLRSEDFQKQLYVSPAFEALWGVPVEHLYTCPAYWIESVVASDRDLVRHAYMDLQASAVSGCARSIQYCIKNNAGQIIRVNDLAIPILDSRRCIAYAGMASRVIDESSEVLQDETSRLFRFFIEKSDSVFWVRDYSGEKQIYINPAYENVWGRSCESLIEKPELWFDTLLPEDRDQKDSFQTGIKENEHGYAKHRYRIVRADGEVRWISDKAFTVRNKKKEVIAFAGIADDITEDVMREQELTAAKNLAEDANHAKSDFLAMMSHELRTPLNAILGMTQVLHQSELTRTQQGQLDVISQSGENLLSLLNDILDFTKLEVGKLTFTAEDIQLHHFVDNLYRDMLPQAHKKSLELSVDIDQDVPRYIMADGKRLRQILSNLLSNAVKYTESGSVKLKITCLQKNNHETTLCFTVIDTGIGIEKSKLESVFRRFQQIESIYQRKHEGVGLGLAIVKELVERMGGSIAVSSELRVGSQFSCIIPFNCSVKKSRLHKAIEFCRQKNVKRDSVREEFDLRVLVVEDNLINQKISRTLLEQLGCKVQVVGDAKSALSSNPDDFDIVFMDIGLPDMNGFDATREFREKSSRGKKIPIIAMTAHVSEADRQRCYQVGMNEVVAKPIMREDLIHVLSHNT